MQASRKLRVRVGGLSGVMVMSEVDMNDDNAILGVNSPKGALSGPWCIVEKCIEEKWAIVALNYKDFGINNPHLGIRWFGGERGTPISSTYPIWFVFPDKVAEYILANYVHEKEKLVLLSNFLLGRIKGEELREEMQKIRQNKNGG